MPTMVVSHSVPTWSSSVANHPGYGIAGLGAVSAFGWGVPALVDGLRRTEPGPRPHVAKEASGTRTFWFGDIPAQPSHKGREAETDDTVFSRALRTAVDEAVGDAKRRGWRAGDRVALLHATAKGDVTAIRAAAKANARTADSAPSARSYVTRLASTPLLMVAREQRLTGPVFTLSASCAGGLGALATAAALLASGEATDAVVAATDVGATFNDIQDMACLGTLFFTSPPGDVCRPFSPASCGFVLAEGAAAVVLTSQPVPAYARLVGTALRNDAYHPTSIGPSHEVILSAVDQVMAKAGIDADDVALFLAHGSGTPQCNAADRAVLDAVQPKVAYALKPQLGHCLGAASLLEVVVAAHSFAGKWLQLPPSYAATVPYHADGLVEHGSGHLLQLALGFGGNVVVALLTAGEQGCRQ